MAIDLKGGDELIISRRRTFTRKDDLGEDISTSELTEISVVRCPDEGRTVVNGSVEDVWEDSKRYIVIKLLTR